MSSPPFPRRGADLMSLDFDPHSLAVAKGHHIGGRFVAIGATEIAVLRPSDHQPPGTITGDGEAAVDAAVASARVHGRDLNRAPAAVEGIGAGTVWVNQPGRSPEFSVPTGGFQDAGSDKNIGRAVVEAYLRQTPARIAYAT